MDLNFVLNDNPTSPRTADTFNIETNTYKFGPVQNAENPTGFTRHNPASEIPLSLVYNNPYHHHYSTLSARSSYSGPSLQSSTAATSPLEMSMSAKSLANLNAENQGYSAMSSEDGDLPTGSFGRHLPPLTSVHSQSSTLSVSGEGPLSPHSASHHYHHQNGLDGGYFPPPSSHGYTYGHHHQQHYRLPIFTTSQHTHSHSYDNALLTFAEVAMGTATPGGRRSLEAEAAAEALTGRRGSDGTLRRNDNPSRVLRREETAARSINLDGNVSCQLEKLSGEVSSHADIECVSDAFPYFLLVSGVFC